jgi:hypothetical protein
MGLLDQAGCAACQLIDNTNRMYTPQNRIVFTTSVSIYHMITEQQNLHWLFRLAAS